MINIWIVLWILFAHWVCDFLLQTDWMAQNKSKDNFALLFHTVTYSLAIFWLIGIPWFFINLVTFPNIAVFAVITFVCHTITDYFTSRLNTKLWNEKKVHWFFVSVGWDQFLHFAQLLLTYYFLTI